MKQFLSNLVAINSVTSSEDKIADYIADVLDEMGVSFKRIGNSLVCKVIGLNTNKAFVLNGHIDTVPVADISSWKSDPFKLKVKDGKAFGLGVSDMKSGLAVMLEMLKDYSMKQPPCDLWFMFAEGEEVNGSGTQLLLASIKTRLAQYSELGGVILEPTSSQSVGIGHKGNMFFEVTASGNGGHSSQLMKTGETASAKIAAFVLDLPLIQQAWNENYKDPLLGDSTINPTAIYTPKTAVNVMPSAATARLDIRFNSKLSDKLLVEIENFCNEYDLVINESTIQLSPLGLCSKSSVLHKAVVAGLPKLARKAFLGATDQCFFSELGINTVIYGPGDHDQMHKPNESLNLVNLPKCKVNIQKLLYTFSQM